MKLMVGRTDGSSNIVYHVSLAIDLYAYKVLASIVSMHNSLDIASLWKTQFNTEGCNERFDRVD